MKQIRFNRDNKPEFYSEIKETVKLYFRDNGINAYANSAMIIKSIIFLSLFLSLYILIISEIFSSSINLILAMALGATQTFIGFNVSHDAIHGSYSSNSLLNKCLGYTYDIMGLNSYVWRISHNKVHHTYTNIPGHDEDLDIAPGLIRLSPNSKLKKYMKFQQYYAFLLYFLTSLSWVFRKDYKKMFQEKIGETINNSHPLKEYVILFVTKGIYYFMFIILPMITMDLLWWEFLAGFLLMHMVEGILAALVFQLAHTVEETGYSKPNEKWYLEESWALSQMKGTANFSVNSKLATFFFGGLNYQIEHHLFPLVCHIHYPAISKIVQKIAEKHEVKYNVNATFGEAITSHYRMLKKFGSNK